ncbi:glycerate kinase [Umezawaea endophytica]|uniref:Glycerate kinase n=1 Tax=Umezawaea endophytica TaxID=1654476 RepID=A0A9X3AEV4_9PSEU|nr:glycerate kinase [Umezawaea endophytica]MCS7477827.1 glycerate kinase [Umezawaea endophytica]
MRVLVAPNAFRGGPGARWVADALASGLAGAVDEVVAVPLSDGGDGALEVLEDLVGGHRVAVEAEDPLGAPVSAEYLVADDGTAFVETARASGLTLVADRPRRPLAATTRGTGQLIAHAVAHGATRVVVTAGGTASVDLGAGALAALGVRFLDEAGQPVAAGPGDLVRVRSADTGPAVDLLRDVRIEVLSDVFTPLGRNVDRFGAQKGVTASDAVVIRAALDAVATALGDRDGTLADTRLLGAGGGLVAGLHAVFDAPVRHGGEFFASLAGLADRIDRADLVLTAEGRVDHGSWDGKVTGLVAGMAVARGKPVVVVAGEVSLPDHDLPAGVRCVELGLRPPLPGQAETAERRHALARAARSALDLGAVSNAS